MSSQVTVLTPHGRRQKVNISPNTTILQIIEDVCKKHNFNSDEYDVKHHNKVLDTSSTVRFTNLPNNAQLELVPALKSRSDGEVFLALQMEDGRRLTGNFVPNNSLLEVLRTLCPEESNPELNPVIIYMRQEIYGVGLLQGTSLRSLGITSGRAMLRLIHRHPDVLKTQANVSAPLPLKPVEEKPYVPRYNPPKTETKKEDNVKNEKQISQSSTEKNESKTLKEGNILRKECDIVNVIKKEKKDATKTTVSDLKPSDKKEESKRLDDFVFLGTRNAMVFSLETSQAVPTESLPEDFFDLTVEDARKIMRDLKKKRLEFENKQLLTSTLRNLDESKKQLVLLNKYKKAIIRVQFPDRTVLQGVFKPSETISSVIEFVKEFLEDKTMQFYLYITPPKQVLEPEKNLLECGFVPGAIVYFGTNFHQNKAYLRRDLMNHFTSSSIASLAASQIRQVNTNENVRLLEDNCEDLDNFEDVNNGASTSAAANAAYDSASAIKRPVDEQKMPKWFKTAK